MATAPSEGPSVPEPGLPEIGPNGELLLPATPEPTSTRFVNEPAPVPRPRVRRHLFHHRFNILPEQYRLPRPRDDPALLMALRVLGVNEVVEVLSEDSEEVEERQSDSEMSDGEESEDENMELAENGDSEENVEDEEIIEEEIEEEEEVEEEVEITEERSDKKEEKHNYDLKSVIPHQLSLLGIDSDNPVDTILRSHVFRTEKPDDDSDTGIVDESQPSTSSGIVNEKYDVEHLENPRKLVNSYIGRQSKINYLEDVNSFSLTEARSVIDSAEKFREVKLKWRKLSKLSIVGESVKKGAPNFGEPQPDFDVSSDEGDSELPRRNRLLPIKRDFDNSEYEDDISTDEEGEPHYSDRERSVDLSSDEDEEVSISSDDKSSENNEDVEMDDSSGIEEDSVNSDQVMETGSEGEETAEGGDENENLKYEENSSEEDEEEDEEQVQSYDDDESEEEDEEDKEEVDEKESIEQGSSVASENEEEDEEEDEEEEEEEDNVNENPEESDNEEEIEENETEEIRDEEGDDEQEDEGETGEEYSDEEEEENEQDEVEPEEEEESVSNREIVVRKSTPEVITLSSDPSVDDNDSIDERQLRKETRRLRRLYYSAEKRAAEMVYARNKIKTAQDTPILIELQEMRLRKKLSILSDTVCTGIEQLSLPCRTSADHFEKEADVLMEEVATSRVLNKSRLNAPQDRDQKEFVPLLEPQENETEKYNKEDCVPPLDIEYNNERAGIRYRKLEMQKGIKSSLANRFIKHNLEERMPPKVPKDEFSAWQHDKLQTKAGFMRAQKEAIAYFMKTHPHLFKTFVQPQYDGVMTRNRAGVPGAPRIGTGFKSTFAPPTQQPSQPEPASSPLVSRLRNERFDDISSPSHSSVSRSPKKVTLNVNGFDLSRKLDEPEENEEDMPEDSQYAEETSQISEQPSTSSSSTSVRRKHRRNLNNVVENSSPIPEKKWRKESQVAESNDKEVKENGKPENDDTPSTSNSASSPVKVIAAKKRGGSKGGKRSKNKQEDEPTYCTCSRISFGEMIGCDNDKCEIEWFHFECVSLTSKPKGKWYCPGCRHPELGAKTPRSAKGSRQEKA